MRGLTCSILTAGLMSLAVCGIAQAAPMRPLSLVIGDARAANVSPVRYNHHWHRPYWHHGGYPGVRFGVFNSARSSVERNTEESISIPNGH
jgi:hypothetical protein